MFDENINYYNEFIKKYDNVDRTSELYRYPITKVRKYTPLKLWSEYDIDIAESISKQNGMFIFGKII